LQMRNSIQIKLIAFAVVGSILALGLIVTLSSLKEAERSEMALLDQLDELQVSLVNFTVVADRTLHGEADDSIEEWKASLLDSINLLQAIPLGGAEEQMLGDEIEDYLEGLRWSLVKDYFEEMQGTGSVDGDAKMKWVFTKIRQATIALNKISEIKYAKMLGIWNQSTRAAYLIAGAIVILLVFNGRHLYRIIIRPINALRKGLLKVGEGDLTVSLPIIRNDELGDLTKIFNEGVVNLKNVTASVEVLNREIHEKQEIQNQLHSAMDKLAESNRELEQFAYVASHDLQEPLRMVSSYTQLLQKRYGDSLGDDANRWIEFATDGAKRMKTLIEDLLAFSRLSTREGNKAEVDMNDVYKQACQNLESRIADTGATISCEDLPVLWGDRSRLISLLQNLIGNALKYRKEGVPSAVEITCNEVEGEYVFQVIDNGIGIESKFADKIFLIFQRLHPHGRYEGTGIGLALCRRIVEQHGGSIRLASKGVDQGTTIQFNIHRSKNEND